MIENNLPQRIAPNPHAPAIDALAAALAARNPAAAALLGQRLQWHAARERRRRAGVGIGIRLDFATGVLTLRALGE